MRSLQLKFSALVVALLLVAAGSLTWIATGQEREALEIEVRRFGVSLTKNLADDAKIPLLGEDLLALEPLVENAGNEHGVVAVRVVDRDGRAQAARPVADRGEVFTRLAGGGTHATQDESYVSIAGRRLVMAAPVVYGDVLVGEAQLELDLTLLVEPRVRETQKQLLAVSAGVVVLGVGAGLVFVALLVGPLRRLRSGVERLTAGDLGARVPPTSGDEVGELTRAFNEMGESLQQKERIQSAFGRYASDYVLTSLLENPEGPELEGAEREVTILFADIRGFTRLSEGLKARDVVSLLNEVFQTVSDEILKRGGTIDKFIGDSVMAYFGAPVPNTDHAADAVAAAVAIQRSVMGRNAALEQGGQRVDVGIGVHTGVVVVGNIGSDRRTDFTAIGDPVNVAARLEKLAGPGEILVSEAVQRRVRDVVKLHFEGERQLSGRQEPVHVYSIEVGESAPTP